MARGPTRRGVTRELARSSWLTGHRQAAAEGWRQLSRNRFATGLSIAVMAVALGLPATLAAMLGSQARLLEAWGSNPTLSVFLHKHVSAAVGQALVGRLQRDVDIVAVEFVHADTAFAELTAAAGLVGADDPAANPLPHVLIVTPHTRLWRRQGGADLAARLRSAAEVDAVLLDLAWVERLDALRAAVVRALFVVGAILVLGAGLMVTNATRALVVARLTDIEVLKLVGATDGYVQRPFIYAGLLHGLLAGVAAAVLLELVFVALAGPLERLLGIYAEQAVLTWPGPALLLGLIGGSTLIGGFGGWLGSSRSLRRFQPG